MAMIISTWSKLSKPRSFIKWELTESCKKGTANTGLSLGALLLRKVAEWGHADHDRALFYTDGASTAIPLPGARRDLACSACQLT